MGVAAAIAEAHERHGNKHVKILFVYVNEAVHGAYRKEGQTDGHSIPQTLQQRSALANKMFSQTKETFRECLEKWGVPVLMDDITGSTMSNYRGHLARTVLIGKVNRSPIPVISLRR